MKLLVYAAMALSGACAGGTSPCFNPSSIVTDNNVIGVSSDPPESVFDPSGEDALAPINLAALLVTGVSGTSGEYGHIIRITEFHTVIRICLEPSVNEVDAAPGCPDGSQVIADLPSAPTETMPFSYTPSSALLAQAVDADPVKGLGGVYLRLQLDFDTSPTPLRATKTLAFQLKGSAASLNHGLELVGTETTYQGARTTVATNEVVNLFVDQTTGLRPLIGPGPGGETAVETYLAYDNSGELTAFVEHVSYAFYASDSLYFGQTYGGVAIYNGAPGAEADEPPPGTPDPPDGLVSAEAVYPGDQGGTYWIVARDDRGAVTWREFEFFAKELRPSCSDGSQLTETGYYTRCAVKLFLCD